MEKELQSKLVEILTAIQNSVSKAADFAWNQLTDIAYTYVIYGRVYETIFMLAAAGATGFFAYKTFRPAPKNIDDPDVLLPLIFARVVFLVMFIVAVGQVQAHLQSFVLVWSAPKVWLLKELAQLVK